MNPLAEVLMRVVEDLRATDKTTHDALVLATRQGCKTLVQIEYGPEPSISVGYRDNHGMTRWVHAISAATTQH